MANVMNRCSDNDGDISIVVVREIFFEKKTQKNAKTMEIVFDSAF